LAAKAAAPRVLENVGKPSDREKRMSKSDKAKKLRLKRRTIKVVIPGNNRKPAPRGASGRIINRSPAENQAAILATATNQPHRAGTSDPRSRLHGSAIGKLLQMGVEGGGITLIQFNAAERYNGLRLRWLQAIAATKDSPVAMDPSQEQSSRPLWLPIGSDEDELQADRDTVDRWNACQQTLQDWSRVYHGWAGYRILPETVRLAVCEDKVRDIGDLRIGLNALASLWGMSAAKVL
jgi:hypothetical protein